MLTGCRAREDFESDFLKWHNQHRYDFECVYFDDKTLYFYQTRQLTDIPECAYKFLVSEDTVLSRRARAILEYMKKGVALAHGDALILAWYQADDSRVQEALFELLTIKLPPTPITSDSNDLPGFVTGLVQELQADNRSKGV